MAMSVPGLPVAFMRDPEKKFDSKREERRMKLAERRQEKAGLRGMRQGSARENGSARGSANDSGSDYEMAMESEMERTMATSRAQGFNPTTTPWTARLGGG